MRAARALLLAWLSVAAPVAQAASASFDFLYIRAHEGNASGGHAAVRFGPWIYDFQHDRGLLVPRREDARRFQHVYRTLENRPIEASRVEVTNETHDLLRDAFERRLLAQSRQLELAGELARDARLLDALRSPSAATLAVRGAGFFERAELGEAPPSLTALRARIAERHGAGWLARRRADAETRLRNLALDPLAIGPIVADPLRYPAADVSIARRAEQSLAARLATEVIEAPHRLRAASLARFESEPLDASTRARLEALRESALESAASLAASRRPDWGEALLLAAARLASLDASLARGRMVLLDALPANARRLEMTPSRRALVPVLLAEARRDFDAARDEALAANGSHELAFGAFEAAASRVAALEAVQQGAPELRVAVGAILPEGVAEIALEPRPRRAAQPLDVAVAAARAAERAHREALEQRYGYDLVRSNCVTELFRTIELAIGEQAGVAGAEDALRFVREESERRLGGRVDPRSSFVPFVSSRAVRARWRVSETRRLASAREHAVARDGSLAAALRESSVLTSSFHRPAGGGGFFLLFTDLHWPVRPLFGAVNLSAALARAGVGVLQLPFDGGRGLVAGLDGALWSVPELFFANVRKGTSEWVPPELHAPYE